MRRRRGTGLTLQQEVVAHRLPVQPGEHIPGERTRLHIRVAAAQSRQQPRRAKSEFSPCPSRTVTPACT